MPFTPVHILDLVGVDGLSAAIAVGVILIVTILLAQHFRGLPSLLLVTGATALFIVVLMRFAFVISFTHGWLRGSPLLRGHTVIPAHTIPLQFADIVSYCLWIGLVSLCVRTARHPNSATPSELRKT